MAWQYQTAASTNGQVQINGQGLSIVQMLNFVGSQGWELAAIVPVGPGVMEFVFKRPA